jgi:hypothetical protein
MKISWGSSGKAWATRLAVATFTVSAFAFAACSSSSSGDDDGIAPLPDGSVSTTDGGTVVDEATIAADTTACKNYWTAYCTKQGACSGEAADTVQACITTNSALCPANFFGGTGAQITAANAATCVTALGAQSCGDFRAGIPADPSCVIPGTRTENEPCRSSAQCASHYCVTLGGGCGLCGREYDPSEDCTEVNNFPYVVCSPGTFCDRYGTHRCVAYDAIKCDLSKAYLGGCPSSTVCVTDGDASVGNCVEEPSLGSACLYAYAEINDPTVFCGAGNCAGENVAARDGGTCTAASTAANGEACDNLVDGGYATCAANLGCVSSVYGAPPTCAPEGVAGAQCGYVPQKPATDGGPFSDYYAYCAPGFYCSQNCATTSDGGEVGTCIAGGTTAGAAGAACDTCNGCSAGLSCVDGKCAPIDVSGCE